LHPFDMSIPSYSGGFYKFYNICPFQEIFYVLVRSYSPAVSFFYGSYIFFIILIMKYHTKLFKNP
jgi:hypothetical protein